jgi:hypothetical protein
MFIRIMLPKVMILTADIKLIRFVAYEFMVNCLELKPRIYEYRLSFFDENNVLVQPLAFILFVALPWHFLVSCNAYIFLSLQSLIKNYGRQYFYPE